MDYEAMSGGELQAECARRGLPSSRVAKATMVKRLIDHDAEQQQEPRGLAEAPTAPAESVIPASVAQAEPAANPALFRKTFTAEPGGPDEETHLAYRQATLQAAADAGLRARSDARLAETSDTEWVYEVSVRPEPAS